MRHKAVLVLLAAIAAAIADEVPGNFVYLDRVNWVGNVHCDPNALPNFKLGQTETCASRVLCALDAAGIEPQATSGLGHLWKWLYGGEHSINPTDVMSVGERSGAERIVVPKGATDIPDVSDFEKKN